MGVDELIEIGAVKFRDGQVKAVADTRIAFKRELFWYPYHAKQLALLKRLARTVYGTRG